ncbi:glycoside hydrolase [Rhypophila decipiens]
MAVMRSAYQACGLVLLTLLLLASFPSTTLAAATLKARAANASGRERISINAGWRFQRFTSNPDSLSYNTLKSFVLPSANDFVAGSKKQRPSGAAPGSDVKFVQGSFDDSSWTQLNLPHDWAIKGPFGAPGVSGGMGKLPSNGVGWYRKNLSFTADDSKKTVYLDVDGAMSYAAVWLNGKLVGGWPFGYASFRLDLTPYLKVGSDNMLAIRLDNPTDNSRWYPGGGIYRNVWLVKVDPVHVGQYGTYITTPKVSAQSATVNLTVTVENTGTDAKQVDVVTTIHPIDASTGEPGTEVATFPKASASLNARAKQSLSGSITITNPALWSPVPAQKPNLYLARTTVSTKDGTALDTYETQFGIRSITYDINKGILVNNQAVRVQGTCNHHDLGSLGAAFNIVAARRQLEALQEMGTNALRTSHNPPAPEFLELADKMGFMVLDEIFDCWSQRKTTNDFHLIFDDWSEPDLRNFLRRDRNHPSIIAWSIGNEVGEQGSAAGGTIASRLKDIVQSEDPTRQITAAMNAASAGSAMAQQIDIPGLNYQGEGTGTSTNSAFPAFRKQFPNRMLWTTESSSAVSSRGVYMFPVTSANSATVGDNSGGNPSAMQVSDYGLYATSWGSSPDKVFEQQDKYPYVAGEFVWTGWDYIGEPTPYNARSSYFGIIDLAGFKKDRFWIYQARWNPTVKMAHILPHWTWPNRVGQVTPVHVFSSADEAELFVNGKSQGRIKKAAQSTYRFRWDKVTYQPGEVKVVTYKNGQEWATETKKTAGDAVGLKVVAEKNVTGIKADGVDLAFVSVAVVDKDGVLVPGASNTVTWKVEGAGEIVSTDNGDATDMTSFGSLSRKVFGGLGLAIVRAKGTGEIKLTVEAAGLKAGSLTFVGK